MISLAPKQVSTGSPLTVFAVLPPGVPVPPDLHCAGRLDRFDLAVPIAARMGVDILLVSQKLVDAVDGWDALRNLRSHAARAPEIWVFADADATHARSFSGLAARVIGSEGAGAAPGSPRQPRPQPVGGHMQKALVLVMGSKGGVGKTLVTANVAAKLAGCGYEVAAIDLDFESGDLSLRLGMTPSLDLMQADTVISNPMCDSWVANDRSMPLSLWAAPARPELAALATPPLVAAIVRSAQKDARFVIVDTPSDADNELLYSILEDSSNVLLVSTPSPGAVRQARVTLELLKRLNYPVRDRLSLVLNRVSRRNPLSVRDAADLVGCDPCAILPDVGHRADLEAYRGQPTVLADPRSRLARSLGDLVAFIWPATAQPGPRGLNRFLPRVSKRSRATPPRWARGRS